MDENIFKRADLRQICSFILFREETVTQTESYEEQLRKARILAYNVLKNVSDGKLEASDAKEDLNEAFYMYQEIYTEIGMKLGARMLFQLLHKDDNTEAKNIFK